MSLFAISPQPLREFVAAFERACTKPEEWSAFLTMLGDIREPWSQDHFSPYVGQVLSAPEELEERMVPTAIPSPTMHGLVLKMYARWTAVVGVGLGESDFFGYPYRVPEERPEIASSPEWRYVVDKLLTPGRIPGEFPFLKANPDNSVACCMDATEVRELLRLEREERLIEKGVILRGGDSDSLLGVLHLAAAHRYMVWHYEET